MKDKIVQVECPECHRTRSFYIHPNSHRDENTLDEIDKLCDDCFNERIDENYKNSPDNLRDDAGDDGVYSQSYSPKTTTKITFTTTLHENFPTACRECTKVKRKIADFACINCEHYPYPGEGELANLEREVQAKYYEIYMLRQKIAELEKNPNTTEESYEH